MHIFNVFKIQKINTCNFSKVVDMVKTGIPHSMMSTKKHRAVGHVEKENFLCEKIHCCIHPKGTEIWEEMCYHFYVKNWECVKGSKLVCLHFLISWIHSQFLRRIRNKAHPKHHHTKETILKDYVLISLLLKCMVWNRILDIFWIESK